MPVQGDQWFQASGRGNGVGLTALREPGGGELLLHVLPKFWRQNQTRAWSLPDEEWPEGEARHAVVYEGDRVRVPNRWAESLGRVRKAGAAAVEDAIDPETEVTLEDSPEMGARDALWARTIAQRTSEPLSLTEFPPKPVTSLWRLFDSFSDSVLHEFEDELETHLGDPLLQDLPQARPFILRRFIREVENALTRRRPRFVDVAEELMVLRGRVPVASLINRAARNRLPILCEFDDLTGDLVVWQTVRAAVELCSQEFADGDPALEQALLCDAALADVSVVPAPALLMQVRSTEISVRRDVRTLYQLAVTILRFAHHLTSPGERASSAGVELKVTSSGLWERLVARALQSAGLDVHTSGPQRTVGVFEGTTKQIDIVVLQGGKRVLILDAKYKAPPKRGFKDVAMGDAYQLYAYVNRSDCPGLLVYPGSDESLESRGKLPLALGTKASQTGLEGHPVGVLVFPFPQEGQVSCPVSGVDVTSALQGVLEKAVE